VNPNWGKNGHEGDIAYIVLSEKIPDGYKPLPIFSDNTLLQPKKSMVTLMGYGQTSDSGSSSDYLKAVDIVFKGFAKGFKGMIMVGPAKNQGPCFGDSGGPAFFKNSILGVTSGSDESLFPELNEATGCSTGAAIYTQVSAFKEWIESSSGQKLLTEAPTPDTTNAGDNGSEPGLDASGTDSKEDIHCLF